ncbi:adenosylmethionine decarboxylase [Paraglaciecola arctica]|uniref:S-adenosylmethionine decarboxylase proenzyme n=1 Tax=Paraglaciecola arctica BSs20135 TaxID=493475 RepID=K6YP54_9ALTE|nr:adenosylmethionine decarboxylase [Paraglaciecola arctica]GAC19952.1 S-adenosylmethionine decarboxylase proenzyme [Paraglaciecola arctica BSs20135]
MENSYTPGKHLLLDLYQAIHLSDKSVIEKALLEAAEACDAKVLQKNFHSFGEEQGITGMLLLAESHISIHTWPESHFAAVDIFMCGNCDPELAIAPIKKYLHPKSVDVREFDRGTSLNKTSLLDKSS